ncbi:cupin domain-containing protein [Halotalea alkalilenta]|uniref:cupin domain-containing protein n=1 Tax=Halotalea alkalilenta TaxID=376489 RepID=UPI0006944728|nr:cupin domain-containing protein [Halotalea alkalilenta]
MKAPRPVPPQRFEFFTPAGGVPNNPRLPLLLYSQIVPPGIVDRASYFERLFRANGWPPQWRWGMFDFDHYHPNTHEALGVFSGSAEVKLGGELGRTIELHAGDALLIPAGVGHRALTTADDFSMVGAYPTGYSPETLRATEVDRFAVAKRSIAALPTPCSDPILGPGELHRFWPSS